jgi:hypothetical protein
MIGYLIGMSINISHGLGQHVWNLPHSHSRIKGMLIVRPSLGVTFWRVTNRTEQQSLVCQITYTIAMLFIKISFVYQLLKIIPSNKWRKVVFGYIVFLALYYLAATLSIALNCIPVSHAWRRLEYQWNPNMNPQDMPKGKCLDLVALQVSVQGNPFQKTPPHIANPNIPSAVGLLTDLICWIFPMWLVSRLSLPPREKFSLLAVFAFGAITVSACVLRLYRLTQTKDITVQRDPAFGQASLSIWSIVEISTAVICACLPTCRPLLKRLFPRLLSYSEQSRPGGARDNGLRPPAMRASELLQSYSSSIQYDEENREAAAEEKVEMVARGGEK